MSYLCSREQYYKNLFLPSSEKHLVLTECAESLGSDPANGTLQSLEIGDVLFAAAHSFLYHYANSTSSSPRYDADRSQDQPPAVPAAQHSDSDPFTSARLTIDCQSNRQCSLSCRAHDKDSHFIVKQSTFNQMETNRNIMQEQPAQTIIPETIAEIAKIASAASAQRLNRPMPPSCHTTLRKPPEIVRILPTEYFDPEYILLFRQVRSAARLTAILRRMICSWWCAKRRDSTGFRPNAYCVTKCLIDTRKITYINLYILPLNYVESNRTPFLYFALRRVNYFYLQRPLLFPTTETSDRLRSASNARTPSSITILSARSANEPVRAGAGRVYGGTQCEAGGAVHGASCGLLLPSTLYCVYHGMPFDLHDPVVMHDRMRTLSTKLMLVF